MSGQNRPAILVYSKSGHSLRAAEALARKTGAELVRVTVNRYRIPGLWVFRAILDVLRAVAPPLELDVRRFADRPWVVVAGPIWAGQLAAPLRSILAGLAGAEPPVGVLSTCANHAELEKPYKVARGVLKRELAATADVENSIEDDPEMDRRLNLFAEQMQRSAHGHRP